MLYDMQLFPSMLMMWSDQRWAFYNYKKALAILKDLSGNLKIPQEFLSWIKKQMVGGFKYPALPTTPSNLEAAGTDEKGRDFCRSYFDWCIWFPLNPVILVYYLAECQDFQECVHVVIVEAPV